MCIPKSLRNIFLSILVVMVSLSGSAFADELLDLIPADSILTVRLNNFDNSLFQLDTYFNEISPAPMGMSMLVRMQFARILGSADLKGVNTSGNFAAYAIVKPGQIEPAITVLMPVSDYNEFVSGNQNVGDPDANGISKIIVNDKEFGVVKKVGNYVIFSQKNDFIALSTDNHIGNIIEACEKESALKKPVWAYVNLQKVNEAYGQFAVEQLNKSKNMMEDMKADMEARISELEKRKAHYDANDPNQQKLIESTDQLIASMKENLKQIENNPMIDKMGNIMDMYIRIVETLLNESKSFSLAIEPDAEVLTIYETYTAIPGSATANSLAANTSPEKADKMINYLQDGAMVNFACRLNKPLMRKFYSDWLCLIGVMTAEKISDEEVARMGEVSNEVIDSLGSTMGMSLWVDQAASPPFMEDCIIEVNDAEAFDKAVSKGIQIFNDSSLFDFYKEMGLELNYDVQMSIYKYKDAKVNSAKLTFKATDPNLPEAQVIEKMYGDGFEYRWAVVDGLCVEAIAGHVDAAIKQLIDEVKMGGASEPASDIKQAVAILGDGADDFFGTFNVVRMLKMISVMPEFPIKDIEVESQSNIAFGGKIGDGNTKFKVVVPKAHVKEIMDVVTKQMTTQNSSAQ